MNSLKLLKLSIAFCKVAAFQLASDYVILRKSCKISNWQMVYSVGQLETHISCRSVKEIIFFPGMSREEERDWYLDF